MKKIYLVRELNNNNSEYGVSYFTSYKKAEKCFLTRKKEITNNNLNTILYDEKYNDKSKELKYKYKKGVYSKIYRLQLLIHTVE